MAVSVLTLPRRNPALARAVTVLPNPASRVPLAVLAVIVIAGFLAVHTIKDLTRRLPPGTSVRPGCGPP